MQKSNTNREEEGVGILVVQTQLNDVQSSCFTYLYDLYLFLTK